MTGKPLGTDPAAGSVVGFTTSADRAQQLLRDLHAKYGTDNDDQGHEPNQPDTTQKENDQ